MENVKKSKHIALSLLDDHKEFIEDTKLHNYKCEPHEDIDLDQPSTSFGQRQPEIIKYGKITFNTTAILHHYPQMECNHKPKVTQKTDLNLPIEGIRTDNNNAVIDRGRKPDNENNNDTVLKANGRNIVDVPKKPVKFTEEKLV